MSIDIKLYIDVLYTINVHQSTYYFVIYISHKMDQIKSKDNTVRWSYYLSVVSIYSIYIYYDVFGVLVYIKVFSR